jgi:hypothetical protein
MRIVFESHYLIVCVYMCVISFRRSMQRIYGIRHSNLLSEMDQKNKKRNVLETSIDFQNVA